MTRHLTVILSLLAWSQVNAEIPADAKILLDKLKSWEGEERAKLEERVQTKRKEVAKALQVQLERETRTGNLEQAVLIKNEINLLLGDKEEEQEHVDKTALEKIIQGSTWYYIREPWAPNGTVKFDGENSTIEWAHKKGMKGLLKYEIAAPDKLILSLGGAEITITYDPDLKSGKAVDNLGRKGFWSKRKP
jgi:hypothetical protein